MKANFHIAGRAVGPGNPVLVIAEIGINHNGRIDEGLALVDAAADAGSEAVKFQYRNLDRVYASAPQEIGDEILDDQIKRNFLSPDSILELARHARKRGLAVGISLFDVEDADAFAGAEDVFSFYKIPSAELTNAPLIQRLGRNGKPLLISTGGHTESEIEKALSSVGTDNWLPLHCVSNYPVALHNARLGYIAWTRRRWQRPVGYSSHDENYEVCLMAMQAGASVIERHITLNKEAPGLDHSSSSTPEEFATICRFAGVMPSLLSGDGRREPNQGERINIQNLGRSFYFARNMRVGEVLRADDIVYRSPKTAVDHNDIGELVGASLLQPAQKARPVTRGHFKDKKPLSAGGLAFARQHAVGLPVRLHDVAKIQRLFDLNVYEFHLSYAEALGALSAKECKAANSYSIHLPDYINSDELIDLFAEDESRRALSHRIVDAVGDFALRLQDLTGKPVPVVGSFSQIHRSKDEFYARHRDYFEQWLRRQVSVLPQWLPPIAWYFGGSVPVSVFNDEADIRFMEAYRFNICMDISHFLLGANYYGFDKAEKLAALLPLSGHLHIADSLGVDGEGMQIGDGDPENPPLIAQCVAQETRKVVEVWQGHLDDGERFREAIERLEAGSR